MSDIQLKPCQFCGDQPKMNFVLHDYWLRCACGASTSMHCTEERAAKVWNRRVDDDGVLECLIAVSPSNCREVLPKFSRKQLLAIAVATMDELNTALGNSTKCVGIIEYFERAYKTRDAKRIHAALAQVFDVKPEKEILQ
ncbi:MAG: Lar family restriction alleviation protein [Gallionella sp.]|nr:Lar family restriction alleviation protein [Gallionella sp.]